MTMRTFTRLLNPTRQRGWHSFSERAHWAPLALLTVFVACSAAQAQVKIAPPAPAVVGQPVWQDEQFDQWVFQQDRTAFGARQRLDSQLALHEQDIDHVCDLTDAQRKKLHLAGRGEIKRFFDRYEAVKQNFQLVKNDQQKVQEIWQEIGPLQQSLQGGMFNDASFLYKTLHNTLTQDQRARYEASARDRQAFRHRANIELVVTLLEQGVPLRDAQRRELISLLTDQTKPPRKSGPYDYYLIMFQATRLPEGKLKSLFDDAQWKVVTRQLNQYQGMVPFLKQSGQWPDEAEEAGRADARPVAPKK